MTLLKQLENLRLSASARTSNGVNSTPVWGTTSNDLINKMLELINDLSDELGKVAGKVEGDEFGPGKPAPNKARIFFPKPGAKDPRFEVRAYLVNKYTGDRKLHRIKSFPGRTYQDKLKAAEKYVEEINMHLANGLMHDPLMRSEEAPKILKISEGLDLIKAEKSHLRSAGSRVNAYFKHYIDYCKKVKCYNLPVGLIDKKHAYDFQQYLKGLTVKGRSVKNRTVNNNVNSAKHFWNRMVELDFVQTSPFKNIKSLSVDTGKNLAYTEEQVKLIKTRHDIHPDLGLLAKTMYYTLARTNEIAHIQRKHIGLYNEKQLYIPSHISKNNTERHINIPDPLMKEFKAAGILDLPPEWYVFSTRKGNGNQYKPIEPQPYKSNPRILGARYRENILNPLKFEIEYTLYSWKHTGVIQAHRAGVPDHDIMQQTGHKNYGSFTKYMKSLGLFYGGTYAEKIPEI